MFDGIISSGKPIDGSGVELITLIVPVDNVLSAAKIDALVIKSVNNADFWMLIITLKNRGLPTLLIY